MNLQDPRRNQLISRNTAGAAAYALALAGTLIGQAKGWQGLVYLCKPLMMIVLSLWFYFSSRRVGDRFTLLVQAGLFFSLIGDVALMFQHWDEFNFLIGLAAFMMAHICYAMAFAQNAIDVGDLNGILVSLVLTVLMVAYGFFFAYDLMPYLDESLLLPVIAYAVAITLMGCAASFRFRRTFPRSFWMVFGGAALFIASDSLLARNRFVRPFEWADMLVMLTYGAAQFLIVAGCLVHVLAPDEVRRRQSLRT